MSNVYKQFNNREILQEPVVVVRGVTCTPYIIGDATYPIWPYLQKNWKNRNTIDMDKQRYDYSMNSREVIIEKSLSKMPLDHWKIGGAYWDILV